MKISIKNFEDLTIYQLHDLLQLRSEVFVVEQDCVYQDIDGKDKNALHIIGEKAGKIVAYTRCFNAGDYFEYPSIGRVVVAKDERQHKYGHDIMQSSIVGLQEHFGATTMKLSAQTYLIKFYNTHGFQVTGEEYLEDGIPHIAMIRK